MSVKHQKQFPNPSPDGGNPNRCYGVDWNAEHVVSLGLKAKEASYIILNDSGTIKAINGLTSAIDFSGTDAATVIQAAINALTRGTMVIKDNLTINQKITVSKSIKLELGKSILTFGSAITMFEISTTRVEVHGGIIQGSNVAGEVAFDLKSGANGCLFDSVRFDHVYRPFYLEGSIWELRIYGCFADYVQNLLMTDSAATDVNINMRDTWASNVGGNAVEIYKSNAVLMHNCEIINVPNGSPVLIHSRYGGDIWISECEFDNYAYPVKAEANVADFHLVHSYCGQGYAVSGGHAVELMDGCSGARITGCHIYSTGGYAIHLYGSSALDIHVVDNRALVASGSSIVLENTRRAKVVANQCNQPIVEMGTADWNLFIGNSGVVTKIGYNSKVVGSMDAEFDVYKKDWYQLTIGVNNTYGSSVVDIPSSGQIRMPHIGIAIHDIGTGETITIKITAWFDDDTSQYIERSYTANGDYFLEPIDLFDLLKNERRITRLEFAAKTNRASTSATAYRRLWGI